jgi:uncharacterized glyoxalase superfamily protein PhnB
MNANVECIIPILNVADIERSLRFYVDLLGFTKEPWSNDLFASVANGNSHIYLSRNSQGHSGTWLWVGVDDARAVHNHLVAHGVTIQTGLTNNPWALEFHAKDPDGHVLRIGSDPDPG